ncbi:hypothetical protein LTSEALA_4369 [Salmonella enterica subsp. enterica serovar Alachua str. R6-377]|uniref:Uncharacterized protein n=1 Tax=Salmonella enterica subsp. enterica serovar Alachua str. R6-377 TaxID=913241 RepID=G5LTC0_SALET|nr:hypothetical protein LTSEALA_4369 [Salmonella enterica subsp. enterica serovar Alachua str. R6-377]
MKIDNGHMRYIKHPGIGAHSVVFIKLRAVMQGHHPAMKIDHAGAA